LKKDILLRSFLFVPANNSRFIEKGLAAEADALIFDMEDAVPPARREAARENLRACLADGAFRGKTVFVRLNPLGSADFARDIQCLPHGDIAGFMPAKIHTAEDIRFLDRLLALTEQWLGLESGHFLLAPLIETAQAMENVRDIAFASERLCALCFGGEDYLNDLGSAFAQRAPVFAHPRAAVALAARAAGLLPIDTPYLEIRDLAGFAKEARTAYNMGYAGCLLLHPGQIAPAHECFSPSAQELAWAQGVLGALERAQAEKGSGVAVYGDVMVGPPIVKRAQRILQLHRRIEESRAAREG